MLPVTVVLPTGDVELRRARLDDLPDLVALLAADPLGEAREHPADLASYRRAFDAIDADPAQLLVAACAREQLVGTLQLTVVPGLSRQGALRAQLDGVRVRDEHRRCGLGAAMVAWAIGEARSRGCALVQLTTDKRRTDAQRFYARLGFEATHEGLKLLLR